MQVNNLIFRQQIICEEDFYEILKKALLILSRGTNIYFNSKKQKFVILKMKFNFKNKDFNMI